MRTNDEIINVLTALKDNKDISLSELARRVGMAKSALSRYFNKTREFPLNKIGDFANALDVTPEYILGFTENDLQPNEKKITRNNTLHISNEVLGEYANDTDLISIRYHGESMNTIIPNKSLIILKKVNIVDDLKTKDIVLYKYEEETILCRFYKNDEKKIYIFAPESTDKSILTLGIPYDEVDQINILGKVITYIVNLN